MHKLVHEHPLSTHWCLIRLLFLSAQLTHAWAPDYFMHRCPTGAVCLTGMCLSAQAGHVWVLKCLMHERPINLCSRALFYAWEHNHYMHECPMSSCWRNQGSHAAAPSHLVHEHSTGSTPVWCWARTAPFGCRGCGGACAGCWPQPALKLLEAPRAPQAHMRRASSTPALTYLRKSSSC